jgi:NAD(P)-dependent dehydrogenase (short-subunit alcohol dehydrogenase family)
MLLDGKVAILSGVGPGLGRESALVFAREGASVVLWPGMSGASPGSNEVAEVLAFFASDRARAITGQQLHVNASQYFG